MSKTIIILIFFLLSNCSKKENIDEQLKKILIEYQEKFPIPSSNIENYVYVSNFKCDRKDTIFTISRSSNGLIPKYKGYGIFQDNQLKPTFIYDEKNFSKNFVFVRVINNSAKKYYLNLENGISESYPPIYTFLIRKKEIKLIKIDTIWRHWD